MDLTGKRILITGGTGTFGHAIIPKLLEYNINKIIIFSRDELKQYLMREKFKNHKHFNKLAFFIGDIRDKDRLYLTLINVDIIIHAAALKRVDSIEYNPIEAIKTNILGTQNLIETSILHKIPYFMSISTDKAVSPSNLYGGTKFCLEKLTIAANNLSGGVTKFSVSRYGNVLGSRGSVVQIFKNLKEQKKDITITHKDMTRFTMDIENAITFVIDNIKNMCGGEIFVPKLLSYKITSLAKYFSNDYKIVGIRAGEKIYEEMISINEGPNTRILDNKFIIIGDNLLNKTILNEKYGMLEIYGFKSYNSQENDYITDDILYKKIEKLMLNN
mgnify:CR=1 FL=1